MNEREIKRLADEAGVDIEGHMLSLPVERQKQIAIKLGYDDDFERYVKETILKAQETQKFKEEIEYIHFDTIEEAEAAGYTVPRWHNETINARLIKD